MSTDRPSVRVDLTDPDLWRVAVPHEELRRLRKESPVAWADHPGEHRGFWVITRHADVVSVSRDVSTFSSRSGVITLDDLDADQLHARRTMLEEDPPRHRMLRDLTAAHFTPRAVRAFTGFVRALAADAVETAIDSGECDLVESLSERVPIRVLARILGVPDREVEDLVWFGNQMIGMDDPEYDPVRVPDDGNRLLPFGHPAAQDAFTLAWELAQQREKEPRDDVMTALALGKVDGERLTAEELGTYFVLLVIAGNETTRHTITSGVHALAEHPAQWRRLVEGETTTALAADELIRWATAIHFHRRTATRDVELNGVGIGAGDKVAMYYASANFDESVFADPYGLDVGRRPNDHVSFGRGGPHFCLGAYLARLEVGVVLEELAVRVRRVEVLSPPVRLRSNHINGIKHLKVRLHPR
jgi:cytochrome P450